MCLSEYHQSSSTKSYHDLTTTIKPPQDLEHLLLVGKKFIPQYPRVNLQSHGRYLDRLTTDIRTKCLMKDSNSAPPKLYCRDPNWILPIANPQVEEGLFKFKKALIDETTNKFLHQPKATNLTMK